ncbi:hypothetical protein NC652_028923 [Populus alba x Populus x berolinensis]|nr:hypothetical protein NC652_028923 [Populus alba x Populus x berolinensis]
MERNHYYLYLDSSFLLQTTNTSPTKLQSLATPFATLSIHKKPTLVNLSKASRFLGPVGFSLTKLLVQYSCLDLPAVLQIEVGELFSFSETFCQTCCAYYVQIHISMFLAGFDEKAKLLIDRGITQENNLLRENSGGDEDAAGIVLRKLPAIVTV